MSACVAASAPAISFGKYLRGHVGAYLLEMGAGLKDYFDVMPKLLIKLPSHCTLRYVYTCNLCLSPWTRHATKE
jgi:hypothetical protein